FYKVEFEYLRRELSTLKESFSDGRTELQDIPAPPPLSEADIDVQELERVHDIVLEQEDSLEFETVQADEDGSEPEEFDSTSAEAEHKSTQSTGTSTADSAAPAAKQFSQAIEAARGEQQSLSSRLEKTRTGFFGKLKELFVKKPALDADTAEELEA